MAAVPLIALLTDFGASDGYPGVMKGVILGIAPATPLVDLTHEIAPQDVRAGAWVLHTAWRYFPEGSVFLCVIDPGVGSARRAIALQAGGRIFVGPDNGLFSYLLADPFDADARAVILAYPRYFAAHPSDTFHGRDIFAPAAAWLATGITIEELGPAVPAENLARLPLRQPTWQGDTLIASCAHSDHFGNILTTIAGDLARVVLSASAARLTIADHSVTARARTFAEGPEGELFLYLDSSGHLAIARRNGSALATLAIPPATLYQTALTITGIEGPQQ
ncbi:MAG TPA: SAM-dependent chlorinase/fluorinase [Ktedonobacterales bacterium]|nr:SAM-dependent chlorinase/fluorinase [Ktedonobacterales bacterium]